jgi:hypothetical protein
MTDETGDQNFPVCLMVDRANNCKHAGALSSLTTQRHSLGATPRDKKGLWCKRQDLAYDVGRAAGGVGMGKLMGIEQLFEGRHFIILWTAMPRLTARCVS